MLTCVPWVKIISIRGVRFRFCCWTRLSMLKKVPELAWTAVNFYSSWESVSPTSGIKLKTKKRSLCPVNCAHLVWFCQLLKLVPLCSIFQGYGACRYVLGVKLDSGCWKKCRPYAIFIPRFEERLHSIHRDTFFYRELSFGELSPLVGSSFGDPLWGPNLILTHFISSP